VGTTIFFAESYKVLRTKLPTPVTSDHFGYAMSAELCLLRFYHQAIKGVLIFKAHRLVIPTSQHNIREIFMQGTREKRKLSLLSAHRTVFWPGISDDIKNAVKAYDICEKHKPAQQKEPLVSHAAPCMPWVKLRFNIIEYPS